MLSDCVSVLHAQSMIVRECAACSMNVFECAA